ncbi:MAG: ATP-binding protein [Candidatus Latescibacteria bacterium]|nr:ATP-binding protein [Candidatus Latescibacterota bacterium]
MSSRNFQLQCSVRVLLLGASLALFFYLLLHTAYRATPLVVGLAIAYQLYALIHYVGQTNRELSRFLLSIQHGDFSQTFPATGAGAAFDELRLAFNQVMDAFRLARAEKEEHLRYLQTIVQHVGVGLIAFRGDGSVELANTAAKRLLKRSVLRNLRDLEPPALGQSLLGLKPGQKALLKPDAEGERVQLAVSATAFRLHEQEYILVSLQNIHSELEEQELEAWQRLIRVLTHEIMNSITPITSLAATADGLLRQAPLSGEGLADAQEAVGTIRRRSAGLLHFVEDYRQLTRLPAPHFQILSVREIGGRIEQLMRPQLAQAGIAFCLDIAPESLEVTADLEQLEQVLINLFTNALQALQGRQGGRIALRARMDERGRVLLEVADNGPGIVPEALEKVFIPFFTTKPDGSGIGLSLCQQIMRLHRGTISARSRPGEETVFTLRF